MAASQPLDFYFDFASPYGYLASLQIDQLAARHGRTVVWRPILLGVIFKITGMKPNMLQPLRGDYLRHDIQRCARALDVPLTVPAVMPLNSLNAARAVYWLEARDPERARLLARALYHAHWGEGRDLGPAEAVAALAPPLGIDPGALAAGMQDQAAKDRLRQETDGAIARGVFGAPFIFVDNEPFWGADRIEHIERWLATGGW